MVKFRVTLTDEERLKLRKLVSTGKESARRILNAQILLQADASEDGMNRTDEQIQNALSVSLSTIHRVRQKFVENNLDVALRPRRAPKWSRSAKISGDVEAQLIALACSDPPPGRARWTVRLLADQLVELGHANNVSRESVRRALKKMTFISLR